MEANFIKNGGVKSMSKRSLAQVFILTMLLVAALGISGPAAAQGTKITFLTAPWGVPPDEAAFKAWEAKTGITVEIQSVQTADLFTRVQTASAAGQPAADVIFLTEEAPSNIVATGNMRDLSDLIAKTPSLDLTDFNKVDFWTMDGKVYGIPTYLQLVMMDYNKKKLADAGFTEPPKTWKELAEQAAAIKSKGVDQYPIAFAAIDWSWYLMALSMGDPMFDKDLNPVFADPDSKAREAMTMLLGFFKDGMISPEMLSAIDPHTLYWSGSGVFTQGWQGAVAVGNNPKTSKQAPDDTYLPLPDVGNTWSFPAAIGIDAKSTNVDAAWQFIQWYVGDENMTNIYNAVGLYPSRTSVAKALDEAGKIAGNDVIQWQSAHTNELPRYAVWWGPFTAEVTTEIRKAAQENTPADQVIDALAKQWNDLKTEYQ